jgi:catechol 2,3-dioxygenase-like lactoylglutathione lyase family enzyme
VTLVLAHVTFDCADPPRVAAFWSVALNRPVDDGANEFFASIGDRPTSPGREAWFFVRVPEARAGKNRVHVDLVADDRAVEVARLVALGAEVVSDHDAWGARWTVLRDVEGNEFCVGEPSTAG